MNMQKIFKKAFTLAEVLITLTIIGIVAAMTIPTLMSKYKDQATVTKLKKAQSIISNAFSIANTKDGDVIELKSNSYGSWMDWTFSSGIPPESINSIFQNIKGTPVGDISSSYASIRSEDDIIFGLHIGMPEYGLLICTDYKMIKGYHSTIESIQCQNIFRFDFTENFTIVPSGTPNSNYTLRKPDTCPSNNAWDNGCTYWTLATGKIKKKAGEWDDRLGFTSNR